MNKRTYSIISIIILVILIGSLLAACGTSSSAGTGTTNTGETSNSSADGQTLMQQRCSVCHSTDRITSAHKTATEWKTTADRMISHGAQLTPAEEQTLIDYLSANYK
jgi:predicted small secreted protein